MSRLRVRSHAAATAAVLGLGLLAATVPARAEGDGPVTRIERLEVHLPPGPWIVSDAAPLKAAVRSEVNDVSGSQRDLVLTGGPGPSPQAFLHVEVLRGMANVMAHGPCDPEFGIYVRDFNGGAFPEHVPYRCLRVTGPLPSGDARFAAFVKALRSDGRPVPAGFYVVDAVLSNRQAAEVSVHALLSSTFVGLPGVAPARGVARPDTLPPGVAAWADRLAEEADDSLTSLFPKLQVPPVAFAPAPVPSEPPPAPAPALVPPLPPVADAGAAASATAAPQAARVGQLEVRLPSGEWQVSPGSPYVVPVESSTFMEERGQGRYFVLRTPAGAASLARLRVGVLGGLPTVTLDGDCRPAPGDYVRDLSHGVPSPTQPFRCLRVSGPLAIDAPRFASLVAALRAAHRPVPRGLYVVDTTITNQRAAEVAVEALLSDDFAGLPGVAPSADAPVPPGMPPAVVAWADRLADEADGTLRTTAPVLHIPPVSFAPADAAESAPSAPSAPSASSSLQE